MHRKKIFFLKVDVWLLTFRCAYRQCLGMNNAYSLMSELAILVEIWTIYDFWKVLVQTVEAKCNGLLLTLFSVVLFCRFAVSFCKVVGGGGRVIFKILHKYYNFFRTFPKTTTLPPIFSTYHNYDIHYYITTMILTTIVYSIYTLYILSTISISINLYIYICPFI